MSLSPDVLRRLRELRAALPSQADVGKGWGVYERVLARLPAPAVLAALDRAEDECDWFPSAATLRRYAIESGGAMPPADRAARAWAEVVTAIGAVGRYRSPSFSDPVTAPAVSRIGGWAGMCSRDSEWLHDWGRKAFATEFQSILEHGVGPGEPKQLVGLHGSPPQLEAPKRAALPSAGGEDAGRVPPPPKAMAALAKLGVSVGNSHK